MKKYFKMLGILISCVFVMTACGGDGEGEITTIDPNAPVETSETSETTVDLTKPIDVKVGFIYPDDVETSTISVLFESAREEMQKALGVSSCYIDNVTVKNFISAVDALKEDGCNVIVATSYRYANSVYKVAKEDKEIYFITMGGSSVLSNMHVFEGKVYEPANVAGLIAAYNSNSNILGIVADPAMPQIYSVLNAYILGAKEILDDNTDVRVNYAYSKSTEETKQAIDDLIAQGCDVILSYQSTDFGIKYCEQKNVKVIGNAYNMPELAPTNYLTGFFEHYNTYIIDSVRAVQYRNFKSDKTSEGLRAGFVRLCEPSKNCKEGTAKISDALYNIIKEGKSNIFTGEIKNNHNQIVVKKGTFLNYTQITEINWLEKSVKEINDFTVPIEDAGTTDFEIKYGFIFEE